MDLRLTEQGIRIHDGLVPWDEVQSITFAREARITSGEIEIVGGRRVITFDLVYGEYLEVGDQSPAWQHTVDELPRRVPLGVDDVAALVDAADAPSIRVLWERWPTAHE